MKMKRSVTLGTILALLLAVIITVAMVAPTFAHSSQNDSLITDYGSGGDVVLQLPSGVPDHPTTLWISVSDRNKRSWAWSHNIMSIWLWFPTRNNFIPVATITDDTYPNSPSFVKTLMAGTPVWNPAAGMQNLFFIADEELEVRMRGDVLTANLTRAVHISLPFPAPIGDLSFDLPPMVLEFRGFDNAFSDKDTLSLIPKPPLSGYTITTTKISKPAWVSVSIPAWCGSQFRFVGTIDLHFTQTFTPPPP